jgi:putative hydrolase of the HAD superfamily
VLVLIDLDNTLNDRAGAVMAWAEAFSASRRLPVGAAGWMVDRDADGYGGRRAVFTAIRDRFDLDESVDDLLAGYRLGVREYLRPVPGADRCLDQLRTAGLTVAIVSNGGGDAQQHKIDALGFRDRVDAVVVSGEVGVAKPDGRIFHLAAEAVGAQLSQAWVVGDSGPHDIEGANRLGLRSIWIRRGRRWDPQAEPPTAIVDRLDDVAPIITGVGV